MKQYVTFANSRVVLITESNDGYIEYAARVDTERGVMAYNALVWKKDEDLYAVLKMAMNEDSKKTHEELEYYYKGEDALAAGEAFAAHSKVLVGA